MKPSPVVAIPTHPLTRPWSEVKSRRDAPKHIATQDFACDNPTCPYFGICDAQLHALVGDGTHGKSERIQRFRCQACGQPFSSRRHSVPYLLKTASQRIAEVHAALTEGRDVSAAVRIFHHREATITSPHQARQPGRPPGFASEEHPLLQPPTRQP